jgi:hypothetical protein
MPDRATPNRFQRAILKGIGIERYIEQHEMRKKMEFETGGKLSTERFEEMERLV